MGWINNRPENWEEIIRTECYDGNDVYREIDTFEAGADAMHKADVEFLEGLFDLLVKRGIFHIDEIRESREWLAFIPDEE